MLEEVRKELDDEVKNLERKYPEADVHETMTIAIIIDLALKKLGIDENVRTFSLVEVHDFIEEATKHESES